MKIDSQNNIFSEAITHELKNHDLIILGYSGRDKSLMESLQKAYQTNGTGKLFWCGYGATPDKMVEQLIDDINDLGRIAYYIATDGFDKTMYSVARHCMNENKDFLQAVEKLKQQLGSTVNTGTSKFSSIKTYTNKIADTNIFPIVFPKNCFQIEIPSNFDEKPWDYCRRLFDNNIMAVPYRSNIYAWGEKQEIQSICSPKIQSEILVTPFTRESLIYKSQFKELLLKTLTALIGKTHSLMYSENKIWDVSQQISKRIDGKTIIWYKGIHLSIIFDSKYSYITLSPTCMYEKGLELSREEKKQFADAFSLEVNASRPNYNIHEYIKKWADRLFGVKGIDFVIPFPGFFDAFKAGLNIPTLMLSKWINYKPNSSTDIKRDSVDFGIILTRKLDQLSAAGIDVAIIYIPEEYDMFTGYSEEKEKFDLHNFVEAYAAQKNISTQFIREKTIDSNMYCQIMWAISLAIYVKSGRVPWTVSGIQKDTAFAGIGYSVNRSEEGDNIVVGCSHIYSSDGQGMKYKLSKINEVTFDRKKNPFLSENEAYRLGLNIKELFYKSFTELPKRVVIHKRTPFRKEEVKGLTESFVSSGIKDIELLEISYADEVRCFEFNKLTTEIDGFPVRRGLCFPLNDSTMYLFTHGIAPSVRNPNFKYIQGGKAIPLPLKIVKHYGNGSITQNATELLGLSKMNWNSFGLYSKLPCTIQSINEIARIGGLLSQYEGVIYDYRYFM